MNGTARDKYHVGKPLGVLSYSVFDWEEDGTVGTVAVPIQLQNATLELIIATSDTTTGKSIEPLHFDLEIIS